MHVIVLGAGVTGITTAWYLLTSGHRVTVVEARDNVALETSFANGGQISISHPEPWSSPQAPLIALRSIGQRDSPLRFRFGRDLDRYRWAMSFLRECLPARHHRNAQAIAELALKSGAALQALTEANDMHYHRSTRGLLHLLCDSSAHRQAPARLRNLSAWGINAHYLDAQSCRTVEPALVSRPDLQGGIYAPDDTAGDAHLFTHALARMVREAGGSLLLSTRAISLREHQGAISELLIDGENGLETLTADAYVVCLGCKSSVFLRPLGLRLPIYPLKGYSVTLPIIKPDAAPVVSITDEKRRLVCSRLGDRLRVAGTAEIAGFDKSIDPARCAGMRRWADEMFPGAADSEAGEDWAGLRPCTPSYVPLIGATKVDRLWLNTGHGSLGWTLACGSAELLVKKMRAGSTGPQDCFSPD